MSIMVLNYGLRNWMDIIVHNNTIFIGSSIGIVFAFDLYNGKTLGLYDTTQFYPESERYVKKNLNASPSISNEILYIGGYDGFIYSIPLNCILNNFKMYQHFGRSPLKLVSNGLIKQYRIHDITQSIDMYSVYLENSKYYNTIVSSDGNFLNLIPKSIFNIPKKLATKTHFTTFPQTEHWIYDRFQYFNHTTHSQELKLEQNFKKQEISKENLIVWNVSNFFTCQPIILDGLIPAAMMGLGYIAIAFGFKTIDKIVTFKFLLLPALPGVENEEFVFIKDINKILVANAIYYNGMIFSECDNFTLSVMGGTITFSEFKMYMQLDELLNFKADYNSKSSVLYVKGNGKNYSFSSKMINQLCDPFLNIISIGTFNGKHVQQSIKKTETTLLNNKLYIVLDEVEKTDILIVVKYNHLSLPIVHYIEPKKHNVIDIEKTYKYLVLLNEHVIASA